jgi:hypothetical protein
VIDVGASELTIHVGKAGVFSAVGHEHWVEAPISEGRIREGPDALVEFAVDARRMSVKPDEKTSAGERASIQETMQRTVLESEKYPEIRFRSTQVTPAGAQAWKVTGTLTLHGVSKAVVADVRRESDAYIGTARFNQTDFGIQPVRIAGGVVRVKNQLEINFKIRPRQGN